MPRYLHEFHDLDERTIKELEKILDDGKKTFKAWESQIIKVIDKKKEQKSKSSQHSYYKKKELLEHTGKLLKGLLVKDMIIKITGSRAGKYRKVISSDKGGIIGMVVLPKKRNDFTEWRECLGDVTTQMHSKVTHVLVDGQFVPVMEWMESSNINKEKFDG